MKPLSDKRKIEAFLDFIKSERKKANAGNRSLEYCEGIFKCYNTAVRIFEPKKTKK